MPSAITTLQLLLLLPNPPHFNPLLDKIPYQYTAHTSHISHPMYSMLPSHSLSAQPFPCHPSTSLHPLISILPAHPIPSLSPLIPLPAYTTSYHPLPAQLTLNSLSHLCDVHPSEHPHVQAGSAYPPFRQSALQTAIERKHLFW